MYVGMTLGLVGTGLLSGRPVTTLAAAGLVATLTPQVRREEAALAELFGDEWAAYSRRVRRWL
jgi:protein-S-isoprenylcysteine O-methyltransferase Ste14